jgi:TPR repeat protein
MYKSFVLHPFIKRLRAHPGFSSADRELIAEAEAHPAYCVASRACVQRCRHASRAHAQQWNVYGSGIGIMQRRALLCRGTLCAVLVRRLMCFQGQCGAKKALHHACCVISRRHFLVSKNAAETLFEKGQRLYGEQRYREAAESWGQAALLQHAPSHAFLSSLLIDGRADVPKDEQRAFEFASGGAALGCVHSKGALGRCLVHGAGVAGDIGRGLALARESAAAGSSFGQFVLGTCYDSGCGVAKDDAEAVQWFRLAAAQGHAAAQCNLGGMFGDGDGVAKDDAEAVQWFRLAAAQGDSIAQCNLGLMLEKGQGVAKDDAEAVIWFRLAAAQGNPFAQRKLGCMFGNGDGVDQDDVEAEQWFRLAAAQGDSIAQFNLGLMFEKGQGVAKDDAEAVQWFRLAAAQEHPCATCALKRLGAVHCIDGDHPQISIDEDTQELCNHFFPNSCCQNLRWRFLKFAAGCSMTQSPNDVLSFVPR